MPRYKIKTKTINNISLNKLDRIQRRSKEFLADFCPPIGTKEQASALEDILTEGDKAKEQLHAWYPKMSRKDKKRLKKRLSAKYNASNIILLELLIWILQNDTEGKEA